MLVNGEVGEVYNICSGTGIALSEVVRIIADEIGVSVDTVTNPRYIRPCDSKEIVGLPNKIEKMGWKRKFCLADTIKDMIAFCKQV